MTAEHSELGSTQAVRWFVRSVLLRADGQTQASVVGDRAERTTSRHAELMLLHKNSQSGCSRHRSDITAPRA